MANDDARSAFYRDDMRARVERFAIGSLRAGVLRQQDRSYDHCYNYFAATKHPTRDMEKSCAILGFYLASWGMYRGSSYLFNKTNSTHFVPVIEYIEDDGDKLRRIDVDCYDADSIEQMLTAYGYLQQKVLPEGNEPVTLITKILLGVFGCTPAYDTYFRAGIRTMTRDHSRVAFSSFNRRSLQLLSEVYLANASKLNELAAESNTWRFTDSASPTGLPLTKAKILDMYLYDLGYRPNPPATDGSASPP